MVQRGHDVKVFRKGVADQKTGAPIRVPDRWRIGSASKAFNGAVALRLVAQGKLSLSDTIGQRLPTLPRGVAQRHARPVAEPHERPSELHQRSRLAEGGSTGRVLVAHGPDRPREHTTAGVPARLELRGPSNTDNTVVALFAEMATGLSYELLLYQLVFDPLHLRRTVMPLGFSMQGLFVHGYDNNATGERDDISEALNMSAVWAAGALISLLFDLNRFIRSLRRRQAVWRRDAGRPDQLRARRGVRAERSRRELGGDGPLQVRHSVRDRLRAHGQLPRLHGHRRELT